MAEIFLSSEGLQRDLAMQINSKRLDTFRDWPFQSDCNCTPSAMVEAGFYYCPTDVTPDQVRCFTCGLELESWEPQDVPWDQHATHSEKCPWVEMKPKELNGTKVTLSQMNRVSSFILVWH
jgi:baculoviral IAP repeat-containing protein 5